MRINFRSNASEAKLLAYRRGKHLLAITHQESALNKKHVNSKLPVAFLREINDGYFNTIFCGRGLLRHAKILSVFELIRR